MVWEIKLIMSEKRIKAREAEKKYRELWRKYYPKLALNVNNDIILCNDHHNESHGWCLN